MRTDCRHYESRTYPSGDIVRKCRIDLAPEAPWQCPAECPGYERRMIGRGLAVRIARGRAREAEGGAGPR